ncbi:MAG: hypothetical protein HY505_02740 [Candidatus Yanofskybacteria bacterium]|nr:hypothetical protein [Candidatus Yanofskybacteria bacterium]
MLFYAVALFDLGEYMATQYPTEREEFQHELQVLRQEISALKIRLGQLTVDLMRKSTEASEAQETLKRWRAELEILADQKGHNLCWVGVPRLLKNTIGHIGKYPDPENVTRDEFEFGCKVYQDDIFGPVEK